MKRTLLISLLMFMLLTPLFLPTAGKAAAGHSQQPFDQLDAYLEEQIQAAHIPGLAIAVVKGDQIVHMQGYGTAGPEAGPVTPQTPFILGSVSKGVTALAVMQLVEAGKLELDAPVKNYLPWFGAQDITIRHLLNQTSGITTRAGRSLMTDNYQGSDAIQIHARKMSAEPRPRLAGESYEYSNANYVLLGAVIEAVTGQPYQDYMRAHIFEPLDMQATFASEREAAGHHLSTGYSQWFGFPVPFQAPYPAGSVPGGYLITSAEDMAHYLVIQLNGGVYQGKQVLSAEGIEILHRGEAVSGAGQYYAMGWEVGEREGLKAVYHSGDVPNFQSYAILLPEHNLGLIMLFNAHSTLNGYRISHLAWDAAHILVGQAPVAIQTDPMIYVVVGIVFTTVILTIIAVAWAVRVLRGARKGKGWVRVAAPALLLLGIALFNLIGFPNLFGIPIPGMLLFSPDLAGPAVIAGGVAAAGAVGFPVLMLLAARTMRENRL